jgi:hypothetical protein
MEVAAVTSVEATSAAVILVEATSGAVILVEALAEPTSPQAEPMCTLAGPILTSPEATATGIGLAAMGVTAGSTDPATPMGGFIRTATGRNELSATGVPNVDLPSLPPDHLYPSAMMVA